MENFKFYTCRNCTLAVGQSSVWETNSSKYRKLQYLIFGGITSHGNMADAIVILMVDDLLEAISSLTKLQRNCCYDCFPTHFYKHETWDLLL